MEGNPAPPPDLSGNTGTDSRGVGAHAAHLKPSSWHAVLSCSDCHLLPDNVDDDGHMDSALPAELLWGQLASSKGATPAYDSDKVTCSGIYCHGATLADGPASAELAWVSSDGAEGACGSCHGVPPAPPHPPTATCGMCHAAVMNEEGQWIAPDKHIDGEVDSGSGAGGYHPAGWSSPLEHGASFNSSGAKACTSCHAADLSGGAAGVGCNLCHPGFTSNCTFCHGGTDSQTGAPPASVIGEVDTSAAGVGAHTVHLAGDLTWRAPIECTACHSVPADALSAGHVDGGSAELTFGDAATAGGAEPSFDGSGCSSVHCHGSAALGGAEPEPEWHKVDGTQAVCGDCHALPPPPPHPEDDQCSMCHETVIGADLSWNDPSLHVNGNIDASMDHPDGWTSPNMHGAAFNSDGAGACTGCHGDDLSGGSSGVSCTTCHPGFTTNCVFCHGGADNQTGAPPANVLGATAKDAPGVGAHSAHVGTGSNWRADFTCDQCHKVPADALSAGHVDGGTAEIVWGDIAASGGSEPVWDGAGCQATWCHGGSSGGSAPSPDWFSQGEGACGSCHGLPPDAPHPASQDCGACHSEVIVSLAEWADPQRHLDGVVDITSPHDEGYSLPSNHGADFNSLGLAACTPCHGAELEGGAGTVSCDLCHPGFKTDCTFCHGGLDNSSGAPPVGVDGAAGTDSVGVGAHSVHLLSSSDWHAVGGCGDCHKVPVDVLSEDHVDGGKAEVIFGPAAKADNANPVWNGTSCTGVYCHGATTGGGSLTSPVWTQVNGTQAACGTCHAIPPGPPPPPGTTKCSPCHGCFMNDDNTFKPEKAYMHINGQVNVGGPCPP